MIIEWQTAGAAALMSAVVNYLYYVVLRRSEDRRDQDHKDLKKDVRNLSELRVVKIEKEIEEESNKRKSIYERLENIELSYMSKEDCDKAHRMVNSQIHSFNNSVLKLEGLAVKTDNLIQRLDDVTKEQISAGKDLSELKKGIEILENKKR
jgi:hypothetical protein